MDPKLLRSLQDSCEQVYPHLPIMQQLAMSQAILESAYAIRPEGSVLAHRYHNLFGIKGIGTAGETPVFMTEEYVKGKKIIVKTTFAANLTQEDSFKQHRHVLSLPRYKSVWEQKTLPEAAQAVYKGGYATNIKYPQLITGIWEQYVRKLFT